MKIVEIKTYSPVYPVKDPFSNAMRTTRERAFGVVEVVTDAGITGWGEGATVPARRALDTQVIGRNPFDYEVIWEALHKAGTDPAGISAVDIALWDIMGKALKQPIHQLLGGAFRTRVQAYATGLFRRERADRTASLVEEARGYVDEGFKAMKMKVGFGPDYDVKNVAASAMTFSLRSMRIAVTTAAARLPWARGSRRTISSGSKSRSVPTTSKVTSRYGGR